MGRVGHAETLEESRLSHKQKRRPKAPFLLLAFVRITDGDPVLVQDVVRLTGPAVLAMCSTHHLSVCRFHLQSALAYHAESFPLHLA